MVVVPAPRPTTLPGVLVSAHDPLCPFRGMYDEDDLLQWPCQGCDVVARVRADERQRMADAPAPPATVTTTTVSTDVRDTIYRGTRWGR